MNIVSVTDFRNNMGTYIDRIIYKDEEFLLKKGKNVVVKVVKDNKKEEAGKKKLTLLSLAGAWNNPEGKKVIKILKAMNRASKREILKLAFSS